MNESSADGRVATDGGLESKRRSQAPPPCFPTPRLGHLWMHSARMWRKRVGPRLLLILGDDALGREQQAGYRGRVLQRASDHFGRIHNSGLHKILKLLSCRIKAKGARVVLDLIDHH